MGIMSRYSLIFTMLLAAVAAWPSRAGTIDWVEWTATDPDVLGTVTLLNASTVQVAFSGGISGACTGDAVCATYWSPAGTYESSPTVDNAPPGGLLEITGGGSSVYTFTFGTPVVDPVIGIVSMGGSGTPVEYDFSAPFTILNSGAGYFGHGPDLYAPAATQLIGSESNGIIGFTGTFSSITFAAPVYEDWQDVTVGIPDAEQTPEPGVWGMALAGMGVLGALRLKRRVRQESR